MTKGVQTFLDLVKINSETKNEQLIGPKIVQQLEDLGCIVTIDDTTAQTGCGFGNILAVLEATDPHKEKLLFLTHIDTVIPGCEIQPIVTDGIIHTDGTTILGADDKAGVAVVLDIIKYLQEYNVAHGRLEFLFTVGEESGLLGARAFDTTVLQSTYGFALDATGEVGEIVVAAPAQVHFTLSIEGKAAHAGLEPEKGINAIYVLSQIISQLPNGRLDEETTLNYGIIQGGNGATNIVQDNAYTIFEIRSRDDKKLQELITQITNCVTQVCQTYGVHYQLNRQDKYGHFKFNDTHPMIKLAVKAAKHINLSGKLTVTGGGSDANILSGKGLPTSVLSVGYEYIHTTKEQIAVAHIETLFDYVLTIIQQS